MKPWRSLQRNDRVALESSHPAYAQGYRLGWVMGETTISDMKAKCAWDEEAGCALNIAFTHADLGILHYVRRGIAEESVLAKILLDSLTEEGPAAVTLALPDDLNLLEKNPQAEQSN